MATFQYWGLEDARLRFYKDEKEVIATNVSTCSLQKQSHKGKLRSNEVAKQPRLHIEHMNSYHKTILTRTFLAFVPLIVI